jgi:hypothetical protein
MINTDGHRLVERFESLIAYCGDLIIDVWFTDFNTLKPIVKKFTFYNDLLYIVEVLCVDHIIDISGFRVVD